MYMKKAFFDKLVNADTYIELRRLIEEQSFQSDLTTHDTYLHLLAVAGYHRKKLANVMEALSFTIKEDSENFYNV